MFGLTKLIVWFVTFSWQDNKSQKQQLAELYICQSGTDASMVVKNKRQYLKSRAWNLEFRVSQTEAPSQVSSHFSIGFLFQFHRDGFYVKTYKIIS